MFKCVRNVFLQSTPTAVHKCRFAYLTVLQQPSFTYSYEHVRMCVCSFVAGLTDHLQSLYSHSSSSSSSSAAAANVSSSSLSSSVSEMTHIHYRSHNYIVEYTPLMLAYFVLCLYLYFSVREFMYTQTPRHAHLDIQTDR